MHDAEGGKVTLWAVTVVWCWALERKSKNIGPITHLSTVSLRGKLKHQKDLQNGAISFPVGPELLAV
jgi:hypothetical protein